MGELQHQVDAINRDRGSGVWQSASEAEIESRYGASRRLFVYGTLQPGHSNHHLLERALGDWQAATVRGHLCDDGWGATMGYPAITLDPQGVAVQGMVLVSERLPDQWARLDEFEGEAYCRLLAPARTRDGGEMLTNVYALRKPRCVSKSAGATE